jgi:hypothetical protein
MIGLRGNVREGAVGVPGRGTAQSSFGGKLDALVS